MIENVRVYTKYKPWTIYMETLARKWGNSLALRIPKSIVDEIGIGDGTVLNNINKDGKIIISPKEDSNIELDKLLAKITNDNLHSEIDSGQSLGNEL